MRNEIPKQPVSPEGQQTLGQPQSGSALAELEAFQASLRDPSYGASQVENQPFYADREPQTAAERAIEDKVRYDAFMTAMREKQDTWGPAAVDAFAEYGRTGEHNLFTYTAEDAADQAVRSHRTAKGLAEFETQQKKEAFIGRIGAAGADIRAAVDDFTAPNEHVDPNAPADNFKGWFGAKTTESSDAPTNLGTAFKAGREKPAEVAEPVAADQAPAAPKEDAREPLATEAGEPAKAEEEPKIPTQPVEREASPMPAGPEAAEAEPTEDTVKVQYIPGQPLSVPSQPGSESAASDNSSARDPEHDEWFPREVTDVTPATNPAETTPPNAADVTMEIPVVKVDGDAPEGASAASAPEAGTAPAGPTEIPRPADAAPAPGSKWVNITEDAPAPMDPVASAKPARRGLVDARDLGLIGEQPVAEEAQRKRVDARNLNLIGALPVREKAELLENKPLPVVSFLNPDKINIDVMDDQALEFLEMMARRNESDKVSDIRFREFQRELDASPDHPGLGTMLRNRFSRDGAFVMADGTAVNGPLSINGAKLVRAMKESVDKKRVPKSLQRMLLKENGRPGVAHVEFIQGRDGTLTPKEDTIVYKQGDLLAKTFLEVEPEDYSEVFAPKPKRGHASDYVTYRERVFQGAASDAEIAKLEKRKQFDQKRVENENVWLDNITPGELKFMDPESNYGPALTPAAVARFNRLREKAGYTNEQQPKGRRNILGRLFFGVQRPGEGMDRVKASAIPEIPAAFITPDVFDDQGSQKGAAITKSEIAEAARQTEQYYNQYGADTAVKRSLEYVSRLTPEQARDNLRNEQYVKAMFPSAEVREALERKGDESAQPTPQPQPTQGDPVLTGDNAGWTQPERTNDARTAEDADKAAELARVEALINSSHFSALTLAQQDELKSRRNLLKYGVNLPADEEDSAA